MQVILQEIIPGLGDPGEVVVVKPGFARNYLLPQKKAVVASSQNLAELEHQKRVVTARQSKLKGDSEELAKQVNAAKVTLSREAGEVTKEGKDGEGNAVEIKEVKLFGSVGTKDIAASLAEQGIKVDRRLILLQEPIKELGEFEISIKLHPEVVATVKVEVVKA